MNKKVAVFISCLFVFMALIPLNSKAEEVELKFASWGPSQHYAALAKIAWIDETNKTLAGRYKIVDYPGGQLYGPKDVHKAVAKGQVDMGSALLPAMLSMVPMLQGVYLPFAFDTIDEAAKAYSGESLTIIEKALKKKRLKLLWVGYLDGVQIFSNKSNIAKVDDFKGLRVLSTSPIFAEIIAALGAAPDTSIPQTEQYMALKRAVSDSMAQSIVSGYFQKSFEVAPYITKMDMSFPMIFTLMNYNKWKSLPKDVQDTLISLGQKQSAYTLQVCKGWEQKFTGELKNAGATVTVISPDVRNQIVEVSKDIWDKWAKENGKDAKKLLSLNAKK